MKEKFQSRHYLDWAATAIPETAAPFCVFGNPSSRHSEGVQAKIALEEARSRCAAVLGVPPETLYFTSGGTEGNALVIHAQLLHFLLLRKESCRILYSAAEHPSVRENCLVLEKLKIPAGIIGVEKDGRVTETTLERAFDRESGVRFAAVMGVNNETGSRMDLRGLVSFIRSREEKAPVHVHADLVQAAGKIPLDIAGWDLDSASISGHKLGAPRGIGLLYLKKPIQPLYTGGEQERGIRPGTENTAGAIALAAALEKRAAPAGVKTGEEKARERFSSLVSRLKKIKRCSLIPEDREKDDPRFSPWILQARFHGVPGAVMVRALDEEGVAVSTGSACSSSSPERPVLMAMGIDESARLEGIRISQGWTTSGEDIDALVAGIEKTLSFL